MKGTRRGWHSKQFLIKSLAGQKINLHQFWSHRIHVTPTNYFLRPEARHRPHQSSLYDAFPPQARNQCLTLLAKMRGNTVTYWHEADFTGRENCSFIRLNGTLRKTLLQAAKKTTGNNFYRASAGGADFKCNSVL